MPRATGRSCEGEWLALGLRCRLESLGLGVGGVRVAESDVDVDEIWRRVDVGVVDAELLVDGA